MTSNFNEIDGKLEPFKACVRIRPFLNSEKLLISNAKNQIRNIISLHHDNKTVSKF